MLKNIKKNHTILKKFLKLLPQETGEYNEKV
jgi:hypothetical protein